MSDAGTDAAIKGSCAPNFVGVRDAFERNFVLCNEVGAAVAVWVDGDLVVNLWGGSADAAGTRPWQENTLTTVLSGTKGLSATCVHQLVDRGELDLQAPVARYWPEFAQAGKQDITLAMVMSHRSGVIGPRTRMSWEKVADWDFVCEQLAAAEPWWEPGTAQGYHMTTFGFILGEVFRRVTGRTIGQHLRTEIAEPLGADVHIGLSPAEQLRCAERVNKPHARDLLAEVKAPGYPTSLAEHPKAGLSISMGFAPDDELASNDLQLWRELEFPGTNGQVSALGTGDVLQRAGPGETAQPGTHGPDPGVPGRRRDRSGARAPGRRPRLGSGLHAQPAWRERTQPADLRPRWAGRLIRVRRPGAPDRLRVRGEPVRCHQVQRRPAQPRAQ